MRITTTKGNKMTRQELESIYCLKKELRMWQERLAELQSDIALNSKVMDGMPYPNTNAITNPTEQKAIKLMEVAKVIEGKISEIKIAVSDIEKFILAIDDSEMRQIIEYRCVQCKKWEDIGELLGYERTTVAKKYDAYLSECFPQFP